MYSYPKAIKAFYMRDTDENGGETVNASLDLLVPGVSELVGGSQREERWSKRSPSWVSARRITGGICT